jgi:hypothetical protein
MMKKDHLVAAILFIIIFSFSISVKGLSLEGYLKCLSDFDHTIKECVRLNFDSFVSLKGHKVHTNSTCCGAIREFNDACTSESLIFESEAFFIRWLVDSCDDQQSSSSPTTTPPSSSSPSTPSTPSSSASPFTILPPPGSSIQPSSDFKPPPLQLPEVVEIVHEGGCVSGSRGTFHMWSELNNTCCFLQRYKGTHCERGEHYDIVGERCCLNCQQPSGSQIWFQVTPRYVGSLD